MNPKQEREFAIELFKNIDNSAFQDALLDSNCWASYLLHFASFPLNVEQVDKLVSKIKLSWEAVNVLVWDNSIELTRKQIAFLVKIALSHSFSAAKILIDCNRQLSSREVNALVEKTATDYIMAASLLREGCKYPLTRKQIDKLRKAAKGG